MKNIESQNHSVAKFLSLSAAIGGAVIFALLPLIASAETVVRTGGSVSVGVNQVVENDFYAAGSSVSSSGEIREDMYVVAGTVTINGKIGQDLTVFGGTVQVHAPVGDDVRVVGGQTVIAGEVGGDLFVIGGMLKVLSSAKIGGNIYFYGGEAEIEGEVVGSVMGRADSFMVDAGVGGGIDVVGSLTLADRAAVTGDVRYDSFYDLSRAQGATVEGSITRGALTEEGNRAGNFSLFIMMAWFFTTLCFFLFFRNQLEEFWHGLRKHGARSGLIGLSTLIIAPILSVILIVTLLGAWLGLMVLSLFGLLLILSLVLVPVVIGRYVMTLVGRKGPLDLAAALAGIATVFLLCYIPVIGKFIIFATVAVILGGLLSAAYRQFKELV